MTDQTTVHDAAAEPQHHDDAEVHAILVGEFDRRVASLVSDLRRLADHIERTATAPAPHRPNPGFAEKAAKVTADVMNALPNLGLSGLTNLASQADVALLRSRAERAASATH